MYDGCSTRVRTAEGYTAPVPIRSGVRQGCPLSPIIFDLAIDPVLRAVTDVDAGLDLLGLRQNVLAYADDIALVANSPEGMRRLLAAAEDAASLAGLRFNPAKCATLHIGAGVGGRVLPTTFVLQGQSVPCLADGEPYHHLGVPTGFSVDATPFQTIGGLLEDLRAVDRSLLAPWQKIETMASNILPRLDFLLRGAAVEKRPLKAADLQ
ncbi:reverse transcriptase rna-dependent dna polymerase subfamily, partial [Lasius niger]